MFFSKEDDSLIEDLLTPLKEIEKKIKKLNKVNIIFAGFILMMGIVVIGILGFGDESYEEHLLTFSGLLFCFFIIYLTISSFMTFKFSKAYNNKSKEILSNKSIEGIVNKYVQNHLEEMRNKISIEDAKNDILRILKEKF